MNNGAIAAFANTILQIRAAKVAADKDTLKDLAEGTDLLSSLSDDHRSKLKGLIDDAMESVGEADDSMSAINKLAGPSRSWGFHPFDAAANFATGAYNTGRHGLEAGWHISGDMAAAATYPFGYAAHGMVDAGGRAAYLEFQQQHGQQMGGYSRSLKSPSGESETSIVAGGMKYVMSPDGAVVQSAGRIGSLVFAPGDVILGVADVPLGPGASLDKAIDYGYVSGTRSVTVRDVSSGQVTTLMF